MCRNIKTLFNFDPPATDDEAAHVARRLLDSLVTEGAPKNREVEARKARERLSRT
jgi:hypothetical protein